MFPFYLWIFDDFLLYFYNLLAYRNCTVNKEKTFWNNWLFFWFNKTISNNILDIGHTWQQWWIGFVASDLACHGANTGVSKHNTLGTGRRWYWARVSMTVLNFRCFPVHYLGIYWDWLPFLSICQLCFIIFFRVYD